MLVVVFVMGLLAGVAVLTMPGDGRALHNEAERMATRASAARDHAITTAAPVAMVASGAGYYFEQRVDGQWQPLPGSDLTAWQGGTTGPAARQRIVFDSLGLASNAAAVRLVRGTARATVRIARDGQVRLDAP